MSENTEVANIVSELEQIQNRDLLVEVIALGDANKHQSFMWGFSAPHNQKTMGFEDYTNFLRSVEVQMKEQGLDIGETVNMSKAYDDYLARIEYDKSQSPINASQAKRFEAIVDRHIADGASGAYFGFICRKVQATLIEKYAPKN